MAPEVTIWTDAQRAATVGRAVELMGSAVRPIGVGGPRAAQIESLSRQLDCDRQDDFRKLLVDKPAAFVLVSTWRGLSREDAQTALAQGSTILALEPIAATLDGLPPVRVRSGASGAPVVTSAAAAVVSAVGRVVMTPSLSASPGWTAATEPQQVIGEPRAIRVYSGGPEADCSLYARLFDAFRAVLSFVDLPETIDASLTGPLSETPEDLRGLSGHISAHARVSGGCAAVVQVSDRHWRHERAIHISGETGTLSIRDDGYELRDAAGKLVDDAKADWIEGSFADLIATQWRRLLDRGGEAVSTAESDAQTLACCLTAQLSARTNEAESPRNLLKMHGLS